MASLKFISCRLFSANKLIILNYSTAISPGNVAIASLGKAKKKLGKMGALMEKVVLPVETDCNKLVNYVCGSNILKEGEDIKLKPDSEYPDWLWNLHIGPPKKLEDMEPNSKEYWLKVRKMGIVRQHKLKKHKKFH